MMRMASPPVRHLEKFVPLTKDEFRERFFARFYDPVFDDVSAELDTVFEKAWDGYIKYRKSPRTRRAASDLPSQHSRWRLNGWRPRPRSIRPQHRSRSGPSRILFQWIHSQ
jgi:hypothetical protein